jgi:hypothetical protein
MKRGKKGKQISGRASWRRNPLSQANEEAARAFKTK